MIYYVVDAPNLACRSFFAYPAMFHGKARTEVAYGFMREVCRLRHAEPSARFVFCFDGGHCLRKSVLPCYKDARSESRKSLAGTGRDWRHLKSQVDRLREEILPSLGYANVFSSAGYEADDLIASFVLDLKFADNALMVSSDKDLYQLLRHNVSMYDPVKKATFSATWFRKEYGLTPPHWAKLKAITGCASDGVPGIRGIGEAYALRYLKGELPPASVAYKSIIRGQHAVGRNLLLVSLPYRGTPPVSPRRDVYDPAKWGAVCDRLGFTKESFA